MDIFAPGEDVTVTKMDNPRAVSALDGTSYSAPYVAGVIATMLEENPSLTPAQISSLLLAAGTNNVLSDVGEGSPNLFLFNDVGLESQAPVADLDKESYSVRVGETVLFSAENSFDPNNSPLSYTWSLEEYFEFLETAEPTLEHTFDNIGVFDLSLSVSDGLFESDEVSSKVTVYDPVIITIVTNSILFH